METKRPRRLSARTAVLLMLNTVLFAAVYYILPLLTRFSYLPQIYAAIAGALAIGYVIYNRGWIGTRIRPEELPPSMSEEERLAWAENAKRRRERSRWMLTVILPILVTFLCDFLYLFVGQRLLGMWK